MGWRDIASGLDERTVITSVIPRSAVGHTLRLFAVRKPAGLAAIFLAASSSLTFELARQKIGGTQFTVELWLQMPMPFPVAFTSIDLTYIVPRARADLHFTIMKPAVDLGFKGNKPFPWDEAAAHFSAPNWTPRLQSFTASPVISSDISSTLRIFTGPDYPSRPSAS